MDTAVPSGNSVAASMLQRLALLTGDAGYEGAGASVLRLLREPMARAPSAFGHALGALDLYLGPAREVALAGRSDEEGIRRMLEELHGPYRPNIVVGLADPDHPEASEEIALLRERPKVDGRSTAYVCERFACRLPVTSREDLARRLSG
jgi:hypothetical protein